MEKLILIIQTILENKGSEEKVIITPQTHLRKDLGFDSFDLAELTVKVEHEFGKDIFVDGVVETVSDILKKLNLS